MRGAFGCAFECSPIVRRINLPPDADDREPLEGEEGWQVIHTDSDFFLLAEYKTNYAFSCFVAL